MWIFGPYNSANHKRHKGCNGTYDPANERGGVKPWRFPTTTAVEAMIDELSGGESTLVRVLLADADIRKGKMAWTCGGYLLAESKGRGQVAAMPLGVQLETGEWLPSGGSMKNHYLEDDGVELSLVVRRAFAEQRKLNIVAEDEVVAAKPKPTPAGVLQSVSDADLLAEVARRGLPASAGTTV